MSTSRNPIVEKEQAIDIVSRLPADAAAVAAAYLEGLVNGVCIGRQETQQKEG